MYDCICKQMLINKCNCNLFSNFSVANVGFIWNVILCKELEKGSNN